MKRVVDTICRDCVFATRDLDGDQDGCVLGRPDRLAANGAAVVVEPDEDGSYYRIEGRFCTAVRNEEWASRRADRSPASLVRDVEAEVRVKPLAVVYAGPESTDGQVEASIAGLKAQAVPMARLALCFAQQMGRAEGWAARLMVEHPGCTWDVINGEDPTDEQLDQYGPDPYLRLVDEAVHKTKLHHYTAARAGFAWPPDYFERWNHAVESDMRMVVALLPAPDAPHQGFMTSVELHRMLYENRGEPVCDKIEGLEPGRIGDAEVATWAGLGLEAPCES